MAYSYLGEPEAARVGVRALFRASPIAGVAALPGDICEMVARYIPRQRWAIIGENLSTSIIHMVTAPITEETIDSPLATDDPLELLPAIYEGSSTLRGIYTESETLPARDLIDAKHWAHAPERLLAHRTSLRVMAVGGSGRAPVTASDWHLSEIKMCGENGEHIVRLPFGDGPSRRFRKGGCTYLLPNGDELMLSEELSFFDFRHGRVCVANFPKEARIMNCVDGSKLGSVLWHDLKVQNAHPRPFMLDENVAIFYYGCHEMTSTFDIREGKESGVSPIKSVKTLNIVRRCGDEIEFVEEWNGNTPITRKYDQRASRLVPWWKASIKASHWGQLSMRYACCTKAYWG
jgi:hypothetical protein